MDIKNYIGITSLTEERKNPLFFAIIFFIVFFCGLILGSEIQKILKLNLEMGWGQDIVSVAAILLLALFFKAPRQLLALEKPQHKNWLKYTIIIGVAIALWSFTNQILSDDPNFNRGLEYYLFELTMPSIAEEIGLRGAVLGFLLHYAKQSCFSNAKMWLIIVILAMLFGIAHLLHVESFVDGLNAFLRTFSAGLGLSWLRIKTGSLFPGIIAHSIMNVFDNILGNLF
ncbi:MAG: CPBP family intramembrane metalloprotease [Bacteroidetes bacterium]|jgi:membrane protease YdiL (CAAX protease family)|nr:CPBP family intramembrane metalloprotease [Bacteroidota bacterium]